VTPEQAGDHTREQDGAPGAEPRLIDAPPAPEERSRAVDEPARAALDDSARREALMRSGAAGPASSPLGQEPPSRVPGAARDDRTQAPGASGGSAATARTTGAGSAPGTPPAGPPGSAGPTSVLPAAAGARPPSSERPRSQPRPAPGRPSARPAARPAGRGRRARLVVQRVDAWSVFLFSLVASVCLGIVLLVAVATLYLVLSNLGVLSSVNTLLGEVLGSGEADEVVEPFFTPGRVLGATAVLAAVDVVLLTVLATLGALLYNLCASLTGGIEVVLGERD